VPVPLNRRNFIATVSGAFVSASLGRTVVDAQPRPMFAYVGCFTTVDGRDADGDGISVFRVDPLSNRWTEVQRLADVANPNFLTVDRRQLYLYAADGANREFATAFSIDPRTGELKMLNRQPTGRNGGLHVIVDPTNGYLLVPHNPGTIAVLPIRPDGSLGPMSDAADWSGTLGPHRTEQTTPHPHHIHFDRRGRFLIVPDKGLDLVHVFTLDTAVGTLRANTPPSVAARSGAAPRHVVLHPGGRFAYVVNELDSTVTTYRFDEDRGTLEPMQVIPTIPTTFTGNNTGAEIAVTRSGRFVYASNRGHDSIAIFAVEESGVLSHVRWQSTLGRTPRFIGLNPSETFLYAANQGSNNIVAFRVDQISGALTPTGDVVEVGAPTCVVFATPGSV
jgi:6-phosphogluconolactonase (cycloisomerase 2 family)